MYGAPYHKMIPACAVGKPLLLRKPRRLMRTIHYVRALKLRRLERCQAKSLGQHDALKANGPKLPTAEEIATYIHGLSKSQEDVLKAHHAVELVCKQAAAVKELHVRALEELKVAKAQALAAASEAGDISKAHREALQEMVASGNACVLADILEQLPADAQILAQQFQQNLDAVHAAHKHVVECKAVVARTEELLRIATGRVTVASSLESEAMQVLMRRKEALQAAVQELVKAGPLEGAALSQTLAGVVSLQKGNRAHYGEAIGVGHGVSAVEHGSRNETINGLYVEENGNRTTTGIRAANVMSVHEAGKHSVEHVRAQGTAGAKAAAAVAAILEDEKAAAAAAAAAVSAALERDHAAASPAASKTSVTSYAVSVSIPQAHPPETLAAADASAEEDAEAGTEADASAEVDAEAAAEMHAEADAEAEVSAEADAIAYPNASAGAARPAEAHAEATQYTPLCSFLLMAEPDADPAAVESTSQELLVALEAALPLADAPFTAEAVTALAAGQEQQAGPSATAAVGSPTDSVPSVDPASDSVCSVHASSNLMSSVGPASDSASSVGPASDPAFSVGPASDSAFAVGPASDSVSSAGAASDSMPFMAPSSDSASSMASASISLSSVSDTTAAESGSASGHGLVSAVAVAMDSEKVLEPFPVEPVCFHIDKGLDSKEMLAQLREKLWQIWEGEPEFVRALYADSRSCLLKDAYQHSRFKLSEATLHVATLEAKVHHLQELSAQAAKSLSQTRQQLQDVTTHVEDAFKMKEYWCNAVAALEERLLIVSKVAVQEQLDDLPHGVAPDPVDQCPRVVAARLERDAAQLEMTVVTSCIRDLLERIRLLYTQTERDSEAARTAAEVLSSASKALQVAMWTELEAAFVLVERQHQLERVRNMDSR